jgi:hypothetical protein
MLNLVVHIVTTGSERVKLNINSVSRVRYNNSLTPIVCLLKFQDASAQHVYSRSSKNDVMKSSPLFMHLRAKSKCGKRPTLAQEQEDPFMFAYLTITDGADGT